MVITPEAPLTFDRVDDVRRTFPGADPAAVKPTQIFWMRHSGDSQSSVTNTDSSFIFMGDRQALGTGLEEFD